MITFKDDIYFTEDNFSIQILNNSIVVAKICSEKGKKSAWVEIKKFSSIKKLWDSTDKEVEK